MDGHGHEEELIDPTLEREIESLLTVDPSPAFLARVRTRVAAERIGGSSAQWAIASMAAVAVVVALSIARAPAPPVPDAPRIAVAAPVLPSARVVAPDALISPPAFRAAASVVAARAPRRPPPVAVNEPEVLISQEEAAALRRLFDSITVGRIEPAMLPDLNAALAPPAPIDDIVLEPITVQPLAELDAE